MQDFRRSFREAYQNLEGMAGGAEYDRLYISDQITALDNIADTIDNKLLPQVRLNDLRIELQ